MIKYIVLGAIIYIIYIFFFKDKSILSETKTKTKDKNRDAQTVIECEECKTYVSLDEAILSNGKYFCSKECVDDYTRS